MSDKQSSAAARARALGLDRVAEDYLADFESAVASLARHLGRLPRDLPPTAEPAQIFRARWPKP